MKRLVITKKENLNSDYSNRNAEKQKFFCNSGKYCKHDKVYFSEVLLCGNCYTLQDINKQKKMLITFLNQSD